MYFCVMCNPDGAWHNYPLILWYNKDNAIPIDALTGANGDWNVVIYEYNNRTTDGNHIRSGKDYETV